MVKRSHAFLAGLTRSICSRIYQQNHNGWLGDNVVRGVYASGTTVYAATSGGLSISTDSGTSFTNKTTADGLGDNVVRGVYASGTTIYAATQVGLSFSAPAPPVSAALFSIKDKPVVFSQELKE